MDLYTMNRQFLKQFEIDEFMSAIWTERYYGNGDLTLSVAATQNMIQNIPVGTFIGRVGSKEVMMVETVDNKDDLLSITGQGLVPWLDNRFVRASKLQEDQSWALPAMVPGQAITYIVQN